MNLSTLTTDVLLTLPPDQPERLFSSPEEVRGEYRELSKRFHPDVPGGNALAFARLAALHRAALKKIETGIWKVPGLLELRGSDGVLRRVRYARDYDLGIGHGYVGHEYVTYAINDDYADLAEKMSRTVTNLKYPSDAAKLEMTHRLPAVKARFSSRDLITTVLHKPSDLVRLQDLIDHLGTRLDPRHVAWVISELLNLACYLEWGGLTHNDLSMETVFICPKLHTIRVLGGWWYAVPVGARMARVQRARTVANLPSEVVKDKSARVKTDLALIRTLGRELLGDPGGSRLLSDKSVPAALTTWLRMAPTATARQDYHEWQDVLTASFGARRFVKLEVEPSAIYRGDK